MTSYHGGKQRIGKALAEVIYDVATEVADEDDFEIKGYCEPFCGMLGVYQHIPELFGMDGVDIKYKAGDINCSTIKMWKRAQKGWKPPTSCTRREHSDLKNHKRSSAVKGFVGHACSFGGQYFGAYKTRGSNHVASQSDKVVRVAKEVKDVDFTCGEYTQFSHLRGYVIYCDPPYAATESRYYDEGSHRRSFDTPKFNSWCEQMTECGNLVFVSEYTQPKYSTTVWSKDSKAAVHHGGLAKGSERLFLIDQESFR